MKKIIICLLLFILSSPIYAKQVHIYSEFDNNISLYKSIEQNTYIKDRELLTINEDNYYRFLFALESLEYKKPNPKKLSIGEKRIFKIYLREYIIYHLLYTIENIDKEYELFLTDRIRYDLNLKLFYRRANQYMDKAQFKKDLVQFVDDLEKTDILNNHKVADLLTYNLYNLILLCDYKLDRPTENYKNSVSYNMRRISKYNNDKKEALFNEEFFPQIMYEYRGYFQAFHDEEYH